MKHARFKRPTPESLERSRLVIRIRRGLERAFPGVRFTVRVYPNMEWDMDYPDKMIGREAQMAEVLASSAGMQVQYHENMVTHERTYL